MISTLSQPSLSDIQEAQQQIAGIALRTPVVRLNIPDSEAEIYLKLENLQPIGSFKLRGAANAIRAADPHRLREGIYTASAGNMAQGVAWVARQMNFACRVVVPDHAPETKLAAISRLGADIIKVPFDEWWQVIIDHYYPGMDGLFIHPVSEPAVIAGNGTIGLEILEDLPDIDAVLVPFGGGGLSSGIAAAMRVLKPDIKIYACEVATAAPLKASLEKGEPTAIDYIPSFVDGIGGKSILSEMWPLVSTLIDDSLVVSPDAVASAVKLLLERNRVLAEGAGATPVAAAVAGMAGAGKIACVISGGNIDLDKLFKVIGTGSR